MPDTAPSASSTTPADGATDVTPNTTITINFSENVTATSSSFKLECPTGTTKNFFGVAGGSRITLTPTSNLPPNTSCTVTVVADQISDTDTNDPPDHMTADYVFSFKTANSPPVAVDDSYSATGNVKINVNDPNEGVLKRGTDDTVNGGSLHGFGATNATADSTVPNGSNSVTTSNGGTVVLASDGTFTYNPPPGYTGASDNFYYDLNNSGGDAVGKVTISISDMIWFVDNSKSSAGDGRLTSPFNTLAGITAINDGGTNHAKSGQTIFISTGSGASYTGGVTLLNNQILICQGASASITTISGITPAPFSLSLPSTGGTPPSLTTSSGSAVTLGSGNTIRGLNIGNTGGTGLSGNTFGTLNVADVELDVSGGPALNLANGAFNGSFRKVSANGGANGIVLSGTTGSFTVTGTGTAGSGGTIQSTTADGISLTNTGPVSLSWMKVQNNKGNGLKSTTAGGFTLQDSSVTGNGDAAGESGLNFSGLTGTDTIARSTISGSRENNLVIRNGSGTLNLGVSNSTFSNTSNTSNTSDGNDGILLDLTGTATVNPTISGSTFSANRGDHFQFSATDSAGGSVVFRQNTLSGGHASALAQDLLIGASGTRCNGSVTYDIDNNTINGAVLSAITTNLTGQTATGATMVGKIRNNRIGTIGQGFSCSQQANGITFNANGSGTHTASVTNNTIRNCAQRRISATANDGSGILYLTVTGNTVAELIDPNPADGNPWGLQGFLFSAGGAGATDSNSVCLALGDATTAALKNSLTYGPAAVELGQAGDFRLRQQDSATVRMPGYSDSTTANVASYLGGRNTHEGTGPATGTVVGDATRYQNASSSCPTPP